MEQWWPDSWAAAALRFTIVLFTWGRHSEPAAEGCSRKIRGSGVCDVCTRVFLAFLTNWKDSNRLQAVPGTREFWQSQRRFYEFARHFAVIQGGNVGATWMPLGLTSIAVYRPRMKDAIFQCALGCIVHRDEFGMGYVQMKGGKITAKSIDDYRLHNLMGGEIHEERQDALTAVNAGWFPLLRRAWFKESVESWYDRMAGLLGVREIGYDHCVSSRMVTSPDDFDMERHVVTWVSPAIQSELQYELTTNQKRWQQKYFERERSLLCQAAGWRDRPKGPSVLPFESHASNVWDNMILSARVREVVDEGVLCSSDVSPVEHLSRGARERYAAIVSRQS